MCIILLGQQHVAACATSLPVAIMPLAASWSHEDSVAKAEQQIKLNR
jgi:hypothetical protein